MSGSASARRRMLMAGKKVSHAWAPLGTPAAVVDINALLYGDPEVMNNIAKFLIQDGTGQEPAGSVSGYQDNTHGFGMIYCMVLPQNAFITFLEAQHKAEAIEVDFFLPVYGDSLILTCGNGQDNLIAVQLHVTEDGELYIKTFQEEETAEFELHGEVELYPHCRVILRLERYGNRGRISVCRGGGDFTAEPLFETNVVGTDPMAFDPSMEFIGFDSGIIFPNNKSHIAKVTWWYL